MLEDSATYLTWCCSFLACLILMAMLITIPAFTANAHVRRAHFHPCCAVDRSSAWQFHIAMVLVAFSVPWSWCAAALS